MSTTATADVQAAPVTVLCSMCGHAFPPVRVIGPSGKALLVPPEHVVPEPARPSRQPVFVREGPGWYEPLPVG